MPRLKTIRRFDEWKVKPDSMEEFFRHIEGTLTEKPKRFRDACLACKAPYTLMYTHIHSDPKLKGRYEAALQAKSDDLMNDALEIADSVREATAPVTVMAAKLAVETRHATASKWDRDRYGDREELNVNVTQWVVRLPTPSASTAEWRKGVEQILNPVNSVPAPALPAPERGDEVSEAIPVSEPSPA